MDSFFLKLLLSFITGAALVTLATIIAERVGTKLGGIITGMPSTAPIALIFIAWSGGAGAAIESTYAMPMGLAAASAFVVVYFLALGKFGRSFVLPLILSLFAWLILAIPAMTSKQPIFVYSLVYLAVLCLLYYFVIHSNKSNPQGKKERVELSEVLARAVFGGIVVSFAVVMARFAGPLYGGTFGTFPAVFSSTFIILHRKHGPEFMREFMRTIPFGSFSAFAFIVSANSLCPIYGIANGIAIAYGVALLALASFWVVQEKFTAFNGKKRKGI